MSDEVTLHNEIVAIITEYDNKKMVGGGGVPVFYTKDEEETEDISMILARINLGMVHDLDNGVKVIIRH